MKEVVHYCTYLGKGTLPLRKSTLQQRYRVTRAKMQTCITTESNLTPAEITDSLSRIQFNLLHICICSQNMAAPRFSTPPKKNCQLFYNHCIRKQQGLEDPPGNLQPLQRRLPPQHRGHFESSANSCSGSAAASTVSCFTLIITQSSLILLLRLSSVVGCSITLRCWICQWRLSGIRRVRHESWATSLRLKEPRTAMQ